MNLMMVSLIFVSLVTPVFAETQQDQSLQGNFVLVTPNQEENKKELFQTEQKSNTAPSCIILNKSFVHCWTEPNKK